MKIREIKNQVKYIKPEDISKGNFFVDEISHFLYYVAEFNETFYLLKIGRDGIHMVERANSVSLAIAEYICDTSRLRLIDQSDIELTYKFND